MLPPDTVSFSGWFNDVDDEVDATEEESMMELERPGEEKKKRLEAKTVAISGVEAELDSDSEEEWWSDTAEAAVKFS